MAAVDRDDAVRFRETLARLIAHVHQSGQVVPDHDLVSSVLMAPAADMTIAEMRALLQQTP